MLTLVATPTYRKWSATPTQTCQLRLSFSPTVIDIHRHTQPTLTMHCDTQCRLAYLRRWFSMPFNIPACSSVHECSSDLYVSKSCVNISMRLLICCQYRDILVRPDCTLAYTTCYSQSDSTGRCNIHPKAVRPHGVQRPRLHRGELEICHSF